MVDFNLGSIEVLVADTNLGGAELEIRTVSVDGVLINEFTGIQLKKGAKITVSFGQDSDFGMPEVPNNYMCPICHENGDLGVAAYDLTTGNVRLYKCLVCLRRWERRQLYIETPENTLMVRASDNIKTKDLFGG